MLIDVCYLFSDNLFELKDFYAAWFSILAALVFGEGGWIIAHVQ